MDKKLTDNEIIKALEEMADYPHYYEDGQILKSALDIINRLKDNERKYRGKVQSQRYEISCNQKNIERYKGVIEILEKDVATAKSEAIKEFAERLKEETLTTDKFGEILLVQDIDNLAKEMVGENNGQIN